MRELHFTVPGPLALMAKTFPGLMDRVGKSLPMELRCTTLGGLSITATSKALEKQLALKFSQG